MKVTLQQVLSANNAIQSIQNEKVSSQFAYAIFKNKAKLRPDIEGLAAAERDMMETENLRINYCLSHVKKDDKGNPVIENGKYAGVDEADPELVMIMKKLNNQKAEHDTLLKSETEIDFHMIDFKDVPEQISPANLENMMIFIKEPK